MHILHLLDPATCGDEGLLACHDLAVPPHGRAESPDAHIHHEFWLIGGASDEQRAWDLGIPTTDRIHPRRLDGARPGIRRLIRARKSRPDVVHCWSLLSLMLARAAFGDDDGGPTRIAILPHISRGLRPSEAECIDEQERSREIICVLDPHARAQLAPILGVSPNENRWTPPIRLLAPPAFPIGGPLPLDRAALRSSLGLEPHDAVVAVLSDPPDALDAMAASTAGGVLHAIGHRTTFLQRRGARLERRGAAYQRSHAGRWGIIMADCSLPQLLAAADVALIVCRDPRESSATCGPTAASLALSMGVPIASLPNLFPSAPSAPGQPWPIHIGGSSGPGRIAVPLADILGTPALRIRLAAEARAWCERARARDGFRTGVQRLWEEAASGIFQPEPLGVE